MSKQGKQDFYTRLEDCAPSVGIEDSQTYRFSYAQLCAFAATRRATTFDMQKIGEHTRRFFGNFESKRPMWADLALLTAERSLLYFKENKHARVYVYCYERSTQPAKFLEYQKRYYVKTRSSTTTLDSAEKAVEGSGAASEKQDFLSESEVEALFAQPFVPDQFDKCCSSRNFMKALWKKLCGDWMPHLCQPPPNTMIIVCCSTANTSKNAYMIQNNICSELCGEKYRNRCQEADLSILFWLNVFSNHDIVLFSTDGDILLAALMHSKYRLRKMCEDTAKNTVHPLMNFTFNNTVYIIKKKISFVVEQPAKKRRKLAENVEKDVLFDSDSETEEIVVPAKIPANADRFGEKGFVYEIYNVNFLYEQVYNYSLKNYDGRLPNADIVSFLPIESFCCMCMLAGNDYIEKPFGISVSKIFDAYFEHINNIGNLVYGNSLLQYVNNSENLLAATRKEYEKSPPDRFTINADALQKLFSHAQSKFARSLEAQKVLVTAANLHFALNYFAHDYKTSEKLNCFELHIDKCNLPTFGFELVDASKPASVHNVRRSAKVCDCMQKKIRSFVFRQNRLKMKIF